jgi:hypothetical protein
MSSNEGSAPTPQSRDEPTALATKANSANPPRRQRPNMVQQFPAWARFVAGVVLVVLVMAVVFFAGFFTARYYGGVPSGTYYGVPLPGEAGPCVDTFCQPAGMAGQHCYRRNVPCPTGP